VEHVADWTTRRSGWLAPPWSTDNPEAVSAYRDGIATLVAGAPYASAMLRRAIVADPGFVLAHVGLAVADDREPGATDPSMLSRPERQHCEIVRAAFEDDLERAAELRRMHLLEYPGDVLIVWLPAVLRRM
jgi:hypothetical protein